MWDNVGRGAFVEIGADVGAKIVPSIVTCGSFVCPKLSAQDGSTPLTTCCELGRLELMRVLVEVHMADVNLHDKVQSVP